MSARKTTRRKGTDPRAAGVAAAATTRRGAPDVVHKRKVARAFNQLFERAAAAAAAPKPDVRRERRLAHLRKLLAKGRNGRPLKAIEVLKAADALLRAGATLRDLRALKPKLPPKPAGSDEELARLVRETQAQYDFEPRAWRLLGVAWPQVLPS